VNLFRFPNPNLPHCQLPSPHENKGNLVGLVKPNHLKCLKLTLLWAEGTTLSLSLSLGSSSPLLSTLTVFKLSGLHVMSMCLSLFEKEKQMISSSPWKQKTRNLLYCLFHLFSCPPLSPCYIRAWHSPSVAFILQLIVPFVSCPCLFLSLFISSSLDHYSIIISNQNSSWRYHFFSLSWFASCSFFIINVSLYLRNLELRQFLFSNATKILVLSCSPVTRNRFSHANEDPCPRNGSKAN